MSAMKFSLILFLSIAFITSLAQDKTNNRFGKGIRVTAADSSFSMKFGVRMQSLYDGQLNLASDEYEDGFQVRRFRLKFDGFVYSPKLEYKIELAISNTDINGGAIPQSGNTSNIVLDAYVNWNFYRNWSLIFGQKKLPGNRERVISSQALQFVDRSNLNSRFNIDRDAGIHLLYSTDKVNLVGALTMGEGRNMIIDNTGGYDYTVRGEFLPFGQFTSGGDYFGSDLEREPTPKLSLAATYDYNDRASRAGGQLGEFFPTTTDLSTIFIDAHFKYRGFSSMIEYVNKNAPDGPLVYDTDGVTVVDAFYTGEGFNWQAGYLFDNNLELAGRYTHVTPEAIAGRNPNTQYTLGLSKYFVGHNLKIQTDLTFIEEDKRDDVLMYRLQLEVAF
jgi:hypothetical protein